jgi:hypothetical protein
MGSSFKKDLNSLRYAERAETTSPTYRSMIDLAPVLTGCHVCRSPLIEAVNKKMRDGVADIQISKWLEESEHYISRITLGKHRREHLTEDHEQKRINAAKRLRGQKKTIKSGDDLAVLVRDYVQDAVASGDLMPTLAEGLRAQEMIDRRQEKGADRDIALMLAGILGGGASYQVIEATEIKPLGVGESEL